MIYLPSCFPKLLQSSTVGTSCPKTVNQTCGSNTFFSPVALIWPFEVQCRLRVKHQVSIYLSCSSQLRQCLDFVKKQKNHHHIYICQLPHSFTPGLFLLFFQLYIYIYIYIIIFSFKGTANSYNIFFPSCIQAFGCFCTLLQDLSQRRGNIKMTT